MEGDAYRVGDNVSVSVTGLINLPGYAHCHMEGTIEDIDTRNFKDIYIVHLRNFNHTIRVHRERLTDARGPHMGYMWEPGNRVQVFDKDGWWEATVERYNARKRTYTVHWKGHGGTDEVSADMIRI